MRRGENSGHDDTDHDLTHSYLWRAARTTDLHWILARLTDPPAH
jgi:hypothetical protein